jgi:hypothetical protein
MRKTLLASIVCASVFAVPAFAQVNLGGAAQVGTHAGAGLPLGAPVHDSMDMANPMGTRAGSSVRGLNQHARHATDRTLHRTATTTHRETDAVTGSSARTDASASTRAGDSSAHADVGLNTADAAGAAGDAGRGVDGHVRDATHSAIQSSNRTAGSVGDAARSAADNARSSDPVGADADVKAKGSVRGH